LQQRVRQVRREKPQPGAEDDLRLHFGERPIRDEKMAEIIAEGAGMTLRDVRRN